MTILDTDHLSILQSGNSRAYDALAARLDRHPARQVATTIVSFHEQMQGWLAVLNRARTGDAVVRAYERLYVAQESFRTMSIVPFDGQAQERFTLLRQQHRHIGTLDLRIASIALIRNATLLSRNLRDFKQVPGLVVEDWTSE